MAPRTIPLEATARTVATIDHAITFDPDRPMLFGGTGSGKSRPLVLPAVEAMLGNAALRAAIEDMRGTYDALAARHAQLLTAAQTAVIESRTGRNPITPIVEALTGLELLPEPGARLREVLPESVAAWPRGAFG